MSGHNEDEKKSCKRKRGATNKRWLPNEEAAIISYIKRNPDFERPNSRTYYDKFLFENDMDVDWNRLRAKVRNMRTVYRKAKEYEIGKGNCNDLYQDDETVRNEMLKICWYLDDFDILFPNEMQSYNNGIYINTQFPSSDDESSIHESFSNINNSNINCNEKSLLEEPAMSLSSDSIKKDILAVQTGMLNFKRQKHDESLSLQQQELVMFREKLKFEKERFFEEMRMKEKEIESQEKLKILELQMKERIAMKELELKEKIAFKPIGVNGKNENNHIV